MKIGLSFRNELAGLPGGQWIIDQFDQIIARISGVWQVEHFDNGRHNNVHATSVTTDSLTLSGDLSLFSAGNIHAVTLIRIGSGNAFQPNSVVIRRTGTEIYFYTNDSVTLTTMHAARLELSERLIADTMTLNDLPTADPMEIGRAHV